jgi:hypothetical protein
MLTGCVIFDKADYTLFDQKLTIPKRKILLVLVPPTLDKN